MFEFRKQFILLFILLFLTLSAYSTAITDSLEILLDHAKKSEKADVQLLLANEYVSTDLEKTIEYAQRAIDYFSNNDEQSKVALAYTYIGEAYSYKDDYKSCITYYLKAISLFQQNKNSEGLAKAYNGIGMNGFYYQNSEASIEEAIKYFNLALKESVKYPIQQANALNNLGSASKRKGENDNALDFFNKALLIVDNEDDKKLKAKINNNLGILLFDLGRFEDAVKHYEIYGNLQKELGNLKGLGIALNNIGNAYLRNGKFQLAIANYQEALKIFEKINFPEGVSTCFNNIGVIYQQISDLQKALDNHQKALEVRLKIGNKFNITESYSNIGIVQTLVVNLGISQKYGSAWEKDVFKHLNNSQVFNLYKESYGNFQKALQIGEEINDKSRIASSLQNIALIYNYSGYYGRALNYIEKALKINKDLQNESEQVQNLILLGSCYAKFGKYTEAEQYFDEAKEISSKLDLKDQLKLVYQYQSDLYERSGKFEKSLSAYKLYTDIKDTLLNKENYKQMTELQTQYGAEKQKQEIELLNKDKALQQSQIKQQRWAIAIFIFIILMVVVVVVVIVRQYNEKKKANLALAQKNDELAQKNDLITHQKKEITDSILYARRIQTAILPPEDFLNKELPEHFILYRPRDIVSGDFYWIHEKNGRMYVITADCTGHGVPGAFMSMLGTSLLNQIIAVHDDLPANEILNMLRSQIITSLHQTGKEGENKDGMDLVFYILDKNKLTLQYAGANNPLIIVRNGELIEFKADKMPIGIHILSHLPFNNNIFQLEKGDCLYSFSDGYPDQFGGPNGKKFMVKQLKQMLVDNASKNMKEQRDILEKAIIDWIGEVEQIDDILVIGVRV